MICEYCKAEIADNTEICPFCGAKIETKAFSARKMFVPRSPIRINKWIVGIFSFLLFLFCLGLSNDGGGVVINLLIFVLWEFLLIKSYVKRKKYLETYDLDTILNNPENVSAEYIVKAMILDEIKKREKYGEELFSKGVIRRKWIYSAFFALALLVAGTSYYSLSSQVLLGASVLLYTYGMGYNNVAKELKNGTYTPEDLQ